MSAREQGQLHKVLLGLVIVVIPRKGERVGRPGGVLGRVFQDAAFLSRERCRVIVISYNECHIFGEIKKRFTVGLVSN